MSDREMADHELENMLRLLAQHPTDASPSDIRKYCTAAADRIRRLGRINMEMRLSINGDDK